MSDSTELKIRKGQAFNLAVAAAISKDKAGDTKTIYGYFIYYYELANLLQGATIEDIKEALE